MMTIHFSFYYYYFSVLLISLSNAALILEGFPRLLELRTRPSYIRFRSPRPPLSLPFAVLLMRSSYNAVDELDVYPMDEFQKDFFLFRQNEWEEYKSNHPNILQGNLADPLYFDFISFAQYVVIANSFRKGKESFIEKSGAEGTSSLVRRSESIKSNNQLASLHTQLVGKKIFDSMVETYPSITPQINTLLSASNPISVETFLTNVQLLLDIFAINQYSLSSNLVLQKEVNPSASSSSSSSSSTLTMGNMWLATLTSLLPANIWSLQVLLKRKDEPVNDFEVKALQYFASQIGFKVETIRNDVYNEANVVRVLRIERTA